MNPKINTLFAATLVLATISVSPALRGADTVLFYDSDGATTTGTGAVGGSGTWDTTSMQWRLTTATGTLQAYTPNTAPSLLNPNFAGTAGVVTVTPGTTIQANTITLTTTGYTIASGLGATINLSSGSGALNAIPTIVASGTETVSAVLTGTAGLAKGGTGTLVISGANTYTGNTTINGGVVSVSSVGTTGGLSSNFGAGTSSIFLGSSGNSATLIYTGAGETSDRTFSISGNATGVADIIENDGSGALNLSGSLTSGVSGARSLDLQGSNGGTVSGIISNGTGTVTLAKAGAGTWTLSNANTYTGGTTVSAGKLLATNSSGSAVGTGSVTVARGATIGGAGIVNASASGATFSVGASGTGTSTVQVGNGTDAISTLTLEANAVSTIANASLTFNLNASNTNSNHLITAGTGVTFGSNVNLSLTLQNSGIIAYDTPYVLIDGTGTGSGVNGSTFSGLTTSLNSLGQHQITSGLTLSFTNDGGFYLPSYLYVDTVNDDIDVEVVPEPGTWALMIGGLALLIVIQRRKNQA